MIKPFISDTTHHISTLLSEHDKQNTMNSMKKSTSTTKSINVAYKIARLKDWYNLDLFLSKIYNIVEIIGIGIGEHALVGQIFF